MSKKKPLKKMFFLQPAHPFKHTIAVFAGLSYVEAVEKISSKEKDILGFLEKQRECFDEVIEGKTLGYALLKEDTSHTFVILGRIRANDWIYWECLMHELHHIVEWIADMKKLEKEIEAKAYLQEHLFRQIRRKLSGNEPP